MLPVRTERKREMSCSGASQRNGPENTFLCDAIENQVFILGKALFWAKVVEPALSY